MSQTGKSDKIYLGIGILLLLWMGGFCFINGDCQSFWIDELSSVGYIRNGLSLREFLDTYLCLDTNLPLYPLILYGLYRIVPYGEQFLLIPSIIFCLAGIVLLAMAAARLRGRRAGFIALCMGVSSGVLMWQAAWEIRCYAMVFFFSAFVLYAYIRKTLKPDRKSLLIYGIAFALCLWTHWFAFILMALYGIVDLILIIRRKISWKQLFCYIPGCVFAFPWLILSFYYKRAELNDFWVEAPQWKNMFWTVLFYVDGNRILWYLCLITGAAAVILAVYRLKTPYSEEKAKLLLTALNTVAIGWVIGIVFLYSYSRPEGSLYVERYFTVVQPQILLLTTLGMDGILTLAGRAGANRCVSTAVKRIAGAAVALLLAIMFVNAYRNQYIAIRKPFEPYREAADYLIEEEGIWNENSLFAGSNRYCALDGFVDFYFEKRGFKPPANIISSKVLSEQEGRFYKEYADLSEEELLSYDRIYYLSIHMGKDEAFQRFLEEHYRMIQDSSINGVEIWERADL